ncbi:MAG: gephyrin-like molybdotransferase Glp [Geobacteraceae bacterium]|nr:gephyrin-like molybdotransferase Glp [Geobacteraceae bacterium]
MVSIEEAQRIILQNSSPLLSEKVSLLQGSGRVVNEDIHAPYDIPAADNSAMDGYAFSHSGLEGNCLTVTGFIPAGVVRTVPVQLGEAVRIMTGAPIPPGCDTVVPIEQVEETGGTIRLIGNVRLGSHIRRRGDDIRAGEKTFPTGTFLRPQEIGMLAAFGKTEIKVYRNPKIGVLATGDELLEPGTALIPGKIMNSNSFSIGSQVMEAGSTPVMLGIADDDFSSIREKILSGLQLDLLITTGGVSVGDKDYVKEVIAELGGEILFWKVNMKPGKPVAFAIVQGKPVFALPGNPVAAMVSFEMFVRPALLRMMGHTRIFRPTIKAALAEQVTNRRDRPHLIRVLVEKRHEGYIATPTGNQCSARLSSLTLGNGLLRLMPGADLAPGDNVEISLLDSRFGMGEASL